MVMFLDKPRFDPASKAVGGEEATAAEIWDATRESMRVVDNANSRLKALEEAYDERIGAVKQATGVALNNPVSSGAGGPSSMAGFGVQEETDPHAEFQRRLEELAAEKPELREVIKPDRPVLEDAKAKAQGAEKAFEDTWSRSSGGLMAWGARLGGGFYGAMHDPVNIFTLPLGPTGKAGLGAKGLLWMGLKQGAANAGTEAMIQPFVQQWRKDSGLDYGLGQAALNIAGSGLFGAAVDIGVRAPVRGARRAAGRPYLGPEEPPAPPPGGDGSPGAKLPGLPEGAPPSAPPSASPIYRGPDPLPPLEALEQAARNAPEGSVLRRASEGDEDALRQLAAELGPDADPAIRRALDELEIEKLFTTPLNVDDGAHLETLARAIREQSGAADLPVGDAITAPVRRQLADIADESAGRALEIEGRKVDFRSIDPRAVTTDAATFQFKSGGDAAGVTDRLRGVTRWDPVSAGKAIVFERADGQMVIADGHQRLGLAQRLESQGQDAKLDAYVFREADGWTPEDVRAYAALKNMRESSGTSLDMAQVMRDRPDLIDGSLPLTDAKLREAAMLARLSPEAFDAVVAGRLPPPFAALIGESVADSARHRGLLDEMAAADLANTQQARLYLKQLMELPTTTETQMTLFGEESFTRTVLIERAQVLDSALKTLKQDKRIFGLLGREADKIEGAPALGRDPGRAQSLERLMEAAAARLADAETRMKGALIGAKSVEVDVANLRRMHEKAKALRSGFDDRTEFRKTVDKLLFFGDPQDILDLRAGRLEHRRDETMRTARQLQREYDNAAAEADGILQDLENLKAQRDIALGTRAPDTALAAPAGARNILAREANQIKAERASHLADLIEKLATSRGTVATILNDAAASVARGLDPRTASRAFVDRIADTLEREGLPGLVRTEEAPKAELAPVRMDDPIGPEAKAQTEDINWALELDDEIMFSIRAFHGTPHDFDRFDMSKIGTGEGEQVFGHGLYFAENEGVAAQYLDALGAYVLDGRNVEGEIDKGELRHFVEAKREGYLDEIIADYQKRRDEAAVREETDVSLQDRLQGRDKASILEQLDGLIANATRVRDSKVEIQGSLFEVDIDVEPHQLLDYDAKLSNQPEMLAKLETVLRDAGSDVSPDILRTQSGSWAYSELEAMLGSADAASKALKEAGIPGLRYLDQGSRGAGEGTRNIVIFDDSLIKITHKNGKAVSAEERKAAVEAMFGLRGFYSPAIRAAESISMKKGTGEQFLKQITKVPGVRKDELEWMGLEEFLQGKTSVTRDEVLAFMRAHQVDLDEKELTNAITAKKELAPTTAEDVLPKIQWSEDWFEQADKVWSYRIGDEQYYITHGEEGWGIHSADGQVMEGDAANLAQAQHMLDGHHTSFHDDPGMAKFGDYKVPGGENYRELLIRLPKLEGKYTSKHFQDQEIVHLRVDDRTGPNGEKVLFINEVQSDLHQAGRRDGYGALSDAERARLSEEYAELRANPWGDEAQDRIAELRGILSEETPRVPNAPFKGDLWLELALKRALLYASENGYDAISWARSDQIAKAVGAEPEKLALQYDQKIGRFLDKYTKKWGAKVEEADGITAARDSRSIYQTANSIESEALRAEVNEAGLLLEEGEPFDTVMRSLSDDARAVFESVSGSNANSILRITPEMRASVMEGQPLAMKGGQSPQATPPRNATLHNTTLSTRAADEMASMRAEIDSAIAKSLPPGWRAEVRQSLVFGDLSERIQKRNPGVPPSLEIEGTFDPYEKIIYVSLAALDPVERAYEEAGHALKAMRLIPQADYAILAAKASEIGARQKFRIDERYGDVYGARWKDNPARLEEALEEEAIMQMVAARARGDTFGRQANAILDKLIKFLRAIRDMLGVKGFRTFEDVFEDMTEGGFARAMEAQRGGGRTIGGEVMAGGPGKTAAGVSGKVPAMEEDIRQKITEALNADDGYYYGLRITEQPLAVGERAPPSKTWYSDFISDDHETFGREAFPDHGEDLSGPSVIGIRSVDDIEPALRAAGITPMDYLASSPYGRSLYFGDHVSLIRAEEFERGNDPGEWILPDGEVVAAWSKSSPGDPSEGSLSLSLPQSPTAADASFIARAEAASEIMFALGDEGKGTTPDKGAEAKPAPERPIEGKAPAKTAAPSLPGGRESKRIRNLINQAAAEGKLPREDADALIQRFDMLEAFHKDGGKAKQQIAKELDAEAEHRKRQKALAELAQRRIQKALTGFRDARGQADPAKAMQALIENLGQHELPQGFTDIAGHQRAIYGMALADLDAMLHEFRKTLITGQTRNKAQLANVVRELHGEATGDEMAASFAQAAAKVMEDLRQRFNAAGGNIAKRKDWNMPQSHDKVALLKAGKESWVDFVQPLLDLKWMKHPLTGDDMPPAEVRKMLGDVWDNLVSDGWHEREASMAFRGVSAIANTRADPRSLIFANADAWMKYSERFGAGDDALATIVSHIRGMTKDIAAMEVLGPNPKAMLTYMGEFVTQQASLRRAGMPAHFPTRTEVTGRAFRAGGGIFARDPVEGYAKSMIARAENMWNIYSGASSAPVNATLAAASQTIRNINVATKLGGATVSALSDPFWQIAARKFAGLPATKIIRDVVAQIGSAGEREARRAGVIAETYLHLHNEGAREGAALSATKISAYVADRVLTLSMLNAVTRYGNHAMSMGIQGHLADMAGKAFADLDPRLQRMFRRWGLEATDWDAIRLDAGGRPREVDFLSPADIRRQLVDNGGDPSIAERYLAMTLGEAQYATLTGSIRGQAMVYGSLRAGTAQRELWSMFMQFKSFAVNLAILQLERIAREFVAGGLSRGAQYMAYAVIAATLGGALVEQLQQLRNGKDPRDMTTAEFWGSAAYRSGGLSIWGDLLYASENRFGGGVASTLAGPSASTLNDILNLTYGSAKKAVLFTDNKERTNFGREATNFVKRYTPGASLWYVRAAWERVLMDNLQRMLDPEADASFRRKLQNARRDYKQEYWWKPGGGAIPQRLPSLGAALPAR